MSWADDVFTNLDKLDKETSFIITMIGLAGVLHVSSRKHDLHPPGTGPESEGGHQAKKTPVLQFYTKTCLFMDVSDI